MEKIIIFIISLFLFVCANPREIEAISDPRDVPNNRYGIHILDKSDIEKAANLVNSSDGDWGYVTIVIRADDRNRARWQDIFDSFREHHLIPIVRIATRGEGENWMKPEIADARGWAEFLHSLNWVVKNRYVILFNEPNHAKEWGGKISELEYVQTARAYRDELKRLSDDFFVLPAGFDMAATNTNVTTEATTFWKEMQKHDPEIFKIFDGWTSHSYPNPNFAADPFDVGRRSIRSFIGEVTYLQNFGLKSDVPVFITETGWVHREGKDTLAGVPTEEEVGSYFKSSFETAWNDDRIVAVTPFVLSYKNPPFDHFSWEKPDGGFYSFYKTVADMKKIQGAPKIENKFEIEVDQIPSELIAGSIYEFYIPIRNTGQAIWEEGEMTTNQDQKLPRVIPGDGASVRVSFVTPESEENFSLEIDLYYKGKILGKTEKKIKLLPPPQLVLNVPLFGKIKPSEGPFTLLVYDGNRVVSKIDDIALVNGVAAISQLHNLVPDKEYRLVLIFPYYLPRQTITRINREKTEVQFKTMIPVDQDLDGAFGLGDLIQGALHLPRTLGLFFPILTFL